LKISQLKDSHVHNSQPYSVAVKALLSFAFLALVQPVNALQPSNAERLSEIKATIEASRVTLRQYEWIETTVVSVNGDEKVRKQERAYYGADGSVQKIVINGAPDTDEARGLRGKIAARAKEGMTEYMEGAMALIKTYVPPNPLTLQSVKDAGKLSIDMLEGNRARFNFQDYAKPGDKLSLEVDMTSHRPLGLTVNTYLDDANEAIALTAVMGQLDDGAVYPSHVTVEAKAKDLFVEVTRSGYRKP
jgi:hypothetical protein